MATNTYDAILIVYNDTVCDIYITNNKYENNLINFLKNTMKMCLTEKIRNNSFSLIKNCRELFNNEIGSNQIFCNQVKDLSLTGSEYCNLLSASDLCYVVDFRKNIICYSLFVSLKSSYKEIVDEIEEYAISEDNDFIIKRFPKRTYSISDDRSILYLDKSFITEEHAYNLADEYAKENIHHEIYVFEHINETNNCIKSFLYRSNITLPDKKTTSTDPNTTNLIKDYSLVSDYLLEIENFEELCSNINSISFDVNIGHNNIKTELLFSDQIKNLYDKICIGDEFKLKLYQPVNKSNKKEYVIYDGVMKLKNTKLIFDSSVCNNVILSLCFQD